MDIKFRQGFPYTSDHNSDDVGGGVPPDDRRESVVVVNVNLQATVRAPGREILDKSEDGQKFKD